MKITNKQIAFITLGIISIVLILTNNCGYLWGCAVLGLFALSIED